MKVVVFSDIGELGAKEGTAVSYYWNPLYNFIGLLPWLLLAAAFLLFKENRCGQALWILLPVVLFRLLWAAFAALMKIPSEASLVFISLIDCLSVGFVLNWLLAERIGNRNRFVTWLLALVLFALVYGVMVVNFGMGTEAIQVSIFVGLTVGILLVSFALAGFMCRKKFGPVRFSIWMAFWVLLMTNGFFMVVAFIQISMSNISFMEMFLQVLMVGFIYAGILIAALLPFEILLFVNRFWRRRFEAVFGLRTKAAVIESVQVDEQSGPEMPTAE
ncbi:MAG: hypothetical protein NTX52_04580 [Planctomycetota bacterium]|nr:hypothetical protein [Planctomycetota bacterium]